jgi:hypothetical protein
MIKKIVFLQMIAFLFLFSCSQVETKKTVSIKSIGWVSENIDLSFWSTARTDNQHSFYDFWISYNEDLSLSEIEYARIYSAGGRYWTIPLTSDYFNISKKYIGGITRFYSSTTTNYLPLTGLKFEIKLKNGESGSLVKDFPAPGSTNASVFLYQYSEDYSSPNSDFSTMVKRAVINSSSITQASSTLSIQFSTDDSKVYNGWIGFYDSSDNYLGYSKSFKDSNGNLVSSIISTLNTNGSLNTVNLSDSDISFQSGCSFSQISKFIVVLTDGNQYTSQGKYSAYDCRSISAKTSF